MRQHQGQDHREARVHRAGRGHSRRGGRAAGRRKVAAARESPITDHGSRITQSSQADTARLFFALWPDSRTQRALGALAQELKGPCGGRAVPAGNVHLTLVFLGDIERARVPRLETLAAGIRAARFDLAVDRVEFWRHNRIVWAGVRHSPGALQELVALLARELAGEGMRVDERPYVAHITLLRNARHPPPAGKAPAVAWPVEKFALVESVPRERGRVYEVVREWPLIT